MGKLTLQEIARQLNVSRITVSKVINNKPGVSEETRRKVIQKLIASEYKWINAACSLPDELKEEEEVKYIAVVAVAPEFSEFWLKIIKAVSDALADSGYECIHSFLSRDEENRFILPKIINAKQISGLIAVNVYDDAIIQELCQTEIPAVFLDVTPNAFLQSLKGDLILLEGTRSIAEITGHILKKGRREIGFIGDTTYSQTILERWGGFCSAMTLNGLAVNEKFCCTEGFSGHFYYAEEIERALDGLEILPEAIVCANDFIAFMVIDYLHRRGLKVPEDVAVSGYDDIREKITAQSSLTTVAIDTGLLGKRLVRQLVTRIDDPSMPYEIIYIKSNAVFRSSTDF